MKVLTGHISPETAFVVDDYPYGFRLRCKIRYWVEYKPGKGCRFVSQTTNPKRGNTWNKPKASTYTRFGLLMVQDEHGHIQNDGGCNEYDDVFQVAQFYKNHAEHLPCDEARAELRQWLMKKLVYEEAKAQRSMVAISTTTNPEGQTSEEREVLLPHPKFGDALRIAGFDGATLEEQRAKFRATISGKAAQ